MGSFYASHSQSQHVRVLLWLPLCEQGTGRGCSVGRRGGLWGGGGLEQSCVCVNVPVFNNRLADDDDADVLKL